MMAGRIAYRFKITGTLVAQTGLHVGSAADGVDVDLQQATDGEGRVHIPGTSLTGALRTALGAREGFATRDTLDWWGDAEKTGASLITICDAPQTEPAAASERHGTGQAEPLGGMIEARPRVSIDPNTRTAVPGHLFSQNVVPPGTSFRFDMTLDVPSCQDVNQRKDQAEAQITAITDLLSGNGLKVGHGATTGLGLVRLTDAAQTTMDLTQPDGLKKAVLGAWLKDNKATPVTLGKPGQGVPPWQLRVTVPWRPKGPFMVKQAVEGGIAAAYPMTTNDVSDPEKPAVRLLLPGSAIKGVVRAHASYILRTLRNAHDVTGDFRDWMSDRSLGEVLAAFGTPGLRSDSGRAVEDPGWAAIGLEAAKGVIDADDVVTEAAIPLALWQEIQLPRGKKSDTDAQKAVIAAIDKLNKDEAVSGTGLWFDFVTRNAIDRWTGGVAAGLLYSAIEPYASKDTTWRPMVFTVDLQRLVAFDGGRQFGEITTVVLTLLLFVLRDIADGYVPFGFATSRGLGEVEVARDKIEFELGSSVQGFAPHDSIPCRISEKRTLGALLKDSALVNELNEAWRQRFDLGEGTQGQ